jgi:hypothetical protein
MQPFRKTRANSHGRQLGFVEGSWAIHGGGVEYRNIRLITGLQTAPACNAETLGYAPEIFATASSRFSQRRSLV